MTSALRALVDADSRRPGPSASDRTRVYAALGVSLGLPAGAVVAAHAASASAATAATSTTGTAVATAVGAASAVGRVALIVKAPLVSVGVGAVLGAALTAYVVKGPVARWSASAHARRAVATATAPARAPAPLAPPIVTAPPVAMPAFSSTATAAARTAPAEGPVPVDERPPAGHAAPRHAVAAPPATTREQRLERAQDRAQDRAQNVQDVVVADEERAPAPASPAASAGVLSAEQALLDPARVALARGDGAGALARLAQHERRFPNGALSQEREAMVIRALVLTGDRDRARAHAESFRSRYPGSLLWPMIAASLDGPLGSRR
jgi:hypothetical protein